MGAACCAADETSTAVNSAGSLQRKMQGDMAMKLEGGDGTPRLYYFGAYGRGEPIRMLLTHAGVKFGDIRLTQE